MFLRKQILVGAEGESLFLWGARQTGKSTLLKNLFPNALWFDLLKSDVFERFQKNPVQFRESILATVTGTVVIVDEIQKNLLYLMKFIGLLRTIKLVLY